MPPFDTRLRAADLEWASLTFICFYAPAASIQRAPLATTGPIASRQSTKHTFDRLQANAVPAVEDRATSNDSLIYLSCASLLTCRNASR